MVQNLCFFGAKIDRFSDWDCKILWSVHHQSRHFEWQLNAPVWRRVFERVRALAYFNSSHVTHTYTYILMPDVLSGSPGKSGISILQSACEWDFKIRIRLNAMIDKSRHIYREKEREKKIWINWYADWKVNLLESIYSHWTQDDKVFCMMVLVCYRFRFEFLVWERNEKFQKLQLQLQFHRCVKSNNEIFMNGARLFTLHRNECGKREK